MSHDHVGFKMHEVLRPRHTGFNDEKTRNLLCCASTLGVTATSTRTADPTALCTATTCSRYLHGAMTMRMDRYRFMGTVSTHTGRATEEGACVCSSVASSMM